MSVRLGKVLAMGKNLKEAYRKAQAAEKIAWVRFLQAPPPWTEQLRQWEEALKKTKQAYDKLEKDRV